MDNDALKTLLLPFISGALFWPDNGRVLFMNGCSHPDLPDTAVIHQYFKLPEEGIVPDIPADESFSLVLMLAGKQQDETRYMTGRALALLDEGGMLVCAGANDAGGRRIENEFAACGLEPETRSKHKCRVAWAQKDAGQEKPDWVAAGKMRPVLDGAFVSRPGIFGWDKIDTGSALLAAHLPDDALSGNGADFGCGYGYLARHILRHNKMCAALYCLDADWRAVQACRENLQGEKNVHYRWTDLTRPQPDLPPLDWVVMNPPFHEGKTAQYSTGTDFIKTASAALKPGGSLWVVANAHLPYETVMDICFTSFEKVTEEKGFKVFHAVK